MSSNEHPDTYLARKKIKEIFRPKHYEIEEEVALDTVTNNMEEEVWPSYRADMVLTKCFIVEFDSKKLHGTKKRRIHDKWRDTNVMNQMNIKTVRLISRDILQQTPDQILQEINYQLSQQKE